MLINWKTLKKLSRYKKDKNSKWAKDTGNGNKYEKEKLCNITSPQRNRY